MPLTNAQFGDFADRPDPEDAKGTTYVSEDTGDVSISDGVQWITLGTAGGGSGPLPIAGPSYVALANFTADPTLYRTYIMISAGLVAQLPSGPPDNTLFVFKDYNTGGTQQVVAGGGDTIEQQGVPWVLNSGDSVTLQYFAGNNNWMVV